MVWGHGVAWLAKTHDSFIPVNLLGDWWELMRNVALVGSVLIELRAVSEGFERL